MNKITQVIWTRQAQKALKDVLEFRYKDIPIAKRIVRQDIIDATKTISFPKQYQKDIYFPQYRKITVRDYRILYKSEEHIAYIMNVVCSKAGESSEK